MALVAVEMCVSSSSAGSFFGGLRRVFGLAAVFVFFAAAAGAGVVSTGLSHWARTESCMAERVTPDLSLFETMIAFLTAGVDSIQDIEVGLIKLDT